MYKTLKTISEQLRCDLFADRETLAEALKFAESIANASSNPPATLTAVYVVANTIAGILDDLLLKNDVLIDTANKKEYQVSLDVIEKLEWSFTNFKEGLLSAEELSYQCMTYGTALYEAVRREYTCFWGNGYQSTEPRTEDITFFSPMNGYSIDDYKKIANLELGQSVTFTESGIHTVVRSK